ncbi:unnamed protein product [Oikopleura dioica]|uniref:C2H2-type domain-containing protein n=1 Tax=Oikopleura dioica TaxID=34765 RepID=E4YI02_OIKDI|nr:unnamed protein product [Oikopleura dioica]
MEKSLYSCEICSFKLTTKPNLARHIYYRHCKKRPLYCPECGVTGKSMNNLVNHGSSIHGKDISPLMCSRKQMKEVNSKKMIPMDDFECVFCGEIFQTTKELAKHQESHKGEKPFTCPLCGRTFQEFGQSIVHGIAIHHVEIDPIMSSDSQEERIKDSEVVPKIRFKMEKCCKSSTDDVKKEENDANQSSASDEDIEENTKQAKRPQRNAPQCKTCNKKFRSHAQAREHENNGHEDIVPESSLVDPSVFTRATDDLISCSICLGLFRDEKDLMHHQNKYHAKNNGQIILHAPVSEAKPLVRIIARTPHVYRYSSDQTTDNNYSFHQQAASFRPLDAEENWQQYLNRLRPHHKIHFADGSTTGTSSDRENGFSLI